MRNQSIWPLASAVSSALGLGGDTRATPLGSTSHAWRKIPASAFVWAELKPPVEPSSALATSPNGDVASSANRLAHSLLTTRPSGFPSPSTPTATMGKPFASPCKKFVGLELRN